MVVTRACNQKFYKIVKSSNNGITSKIKFCFKVANNVFTKINLCYEATKWLCGTTLIFFKFFAKYADQKFTEFIEECQKSTNSSTWARASKFLGYHLSSTCVGPALSLKYFKIVVDWTIVIGTWHLWSFSTESWSTGICLRGSSGWLAFSPKSRDTLISSKGIWFIFKNWMQKRLGWLIRSANSLRLFMMILTKFSFTHNQFSKIFLAVWTLNLIVGKQLILCVNTR